MSHKLYTHLSRSACLTHREMLQSDSPPVSSAQLAASLLELVEFMLTRDTSPELMLGGAIPAESQES